MPAVMIIGYVVAMLDLPTGHRHDRVAGGVAFSHH